MSRYEPVGRPLKRCEYEIVFLSRQAEKGWRDCLSAARNATVDAWDRLTTAPTEKDDRLYRLRSPHRTGTHGGRTYDRFQYKITNGGRLWYFVDETPNGKVAGQVLLERCEPGHPKETD